MRHKTLLLVVMLCASAMADDTTFELGGHTKLRAVGQSYPDDSLFRDLVGATSLDSAAELRLTLSARTAGWTFASDYQLVGIHSEFLPAGLPDDGERLFDLTRVISEGAETAWLHRLDRLWLGYATEQFVMRVGRQALSWGNGLYFHPMDLVNPFDPETIDTEYKTGDDMLYMQFLRDNGDDIQAAGVFRRDPATGEASRDAGTAALKYHGFAGDYEYDVLVAENYDNSVLGVGGVASVGGAVWRGDIVITDTDDRTQVDIVINASYSWIWDGRNVSGAAEYYRDRDDRNYLAASLLIEVTPLLTMTPTLIGSIDDPSGLLQLVTQYSLGDNLTLLASLNLPFGASGTEFGGPESEVPGRYYSYDAGLFAQLAWYF